VLVGVDGGLFALIDIALVVGKCKVVGHERDGVGLSKQRVLILLC